MNIKEKSEFRVLIVYPNLTMMLVPSLAIGVFTRIFKSLGYVVDLFDTTHYVAEENSSPQNRVKFLQAREFDETNDFGVRFRTDILGDFRRKVEEFKPDFMIFSVVEDVFRQALSLLDSVKDLNVAHLFGGVFPTAAPEVCIKHPLINHIGLGEGETVIEQVAEAIRLDQPITNIPSTWHKDAAGVITRNKRAPLIDINTSVPDFSLFDPARFYRPMGGRIFRTIPVETYRGCPFRCTYCNSPMQVTLAKQAAVGSFLRRKTVQSVREELRMLVKLYSPQFFYFIDDSFTARPEREIFDFCDMYEEFKLPFWFNTRPETCSLKMLQRLKEVGAYRISFGIESGNEQYRTQVLRRNGTNDEIRGYFDTIVESGIAFSVNLIIGFPGESRELVMDTVRFVKTITGFDTVTISIFTPYHGTVLRDVAVKNGWLAKDYITKHTTSSSALVMPPPFLSSADVDGLMRVLPLYIYFPETGWEAIRRAEIDDAEGNRLLAHYSEIYRINFLKDNQDEEKVFAVDGASGCRSNPKDAFRVSYESPKRYTAAELVHLSIG